MLLAQVQAAAGAWSQQADLEWIADLNPFHQADMPTASIRRCERRCSAKRRRALPAASPIAGSCRANAAGERSPTSIAEPEIEQAPPCPVCACYEAFHGLNWSIGGDPSCLYDSSNGGHWFITEIVSASPESAGGAFTGCFSAVAKVDGSASTSNFTSSQPREQERGQAFDWPTFGITQRRSRGRLGA